MRIYIFNINRLEGNNRFFLWPTFFVFELLSYSSIQRCPLTSLWVGKVNRIISLVVGVLLTLWLRLQLDLIMKSNFICTYYQYSNNIWLDGYLFDFLQKKTIDSWLRNYVIFTGFLFSERLVFDILIQFYTNFFINYFRDNIIFESPTISSILSSIVFAYVLIVVIVSLTILTIL